MRALIVLCCLAAGCFGGDVEDALAVAGETDSARFVRSSASFRLSAGFSAVKTDTDVDDAVAEAGDDDLPPRSVRSSLQADRISGPKNKVQIETVTDNKSPGYSPYWPWQAIPYGFGNTFGAGAIFPPTLIIPVPVQVPAVPGQICSSKVDYNQQSESVSKPSPPPPMRDEVPARPFPSFVRPDKLDQLPVSPHIESTVSSQQLLQHFRTQLPQSPELPPILLSDHDASERISLPDDNFLDDEPKEEEQPSLKRNTQQSYTTNIRNREPSRPRFNESLVLRGDLTVPRADYTETYIARMDGPSGNARVDYHGGSTVAFRMANVDGSVQRVEVSIDRSGENAFRRCGKATTPVSSAEDRRNPALPDIDLFSFAGYEQTEIGVIERWRYISSSRPGELGGAPGETLTTSHDLLLVRNPDDTAIPLTYIVSTNSSVLGPACDGYVHRYHVIQENKRDSKFFNPNFNEICDVMERLDITNADHVARLDPLREFTMPQRDPRYDGIYATFKTKHNRHYVDNVEEAIRKNVLIQHDRFISSGNRQGATFTMKPNYLGDRLAEEQRQLLGVVPAAGEHASEEFPHRRATIRAAEAKLPKQFDWRSRGAVTPVKFQGADCSSCWAFAVVGSVEGALFIRKRRLVPLSEQCLVDCARPFGAKGCRRGTWPNKAFDYVQNVGLPALDEYPAYKAKEDTCEDKTVPPVTRISAHVNVTANSVPALKVAIRRHAPTVVIIDSNPKSFIFHSKGVLYDDRCSKGPKNLNHAVLAVGWGERKGEPHFILKNSWGETWGERGYIRVHARSNTCGVLAKPSYPRLEESDVLKPFNSENNRPKARETDNADYMDS